MEYYRVRISTSMWNGMLYFLWHNHCFPKYTKSLLFLKKYNKEMKEGRYCAVCTGGLDWWVCVRIKALHRQDLDINNIGSTMISDLPWLCLARAHIHRHALVSTGFLFPCRYQDMM